MLGKVINYLKKREDDEARELLKSVITDAVVAVTRGIRLVDQYDLRNNTQSKYEACPIDSSDWIAFINRAGTLIHVMRHGAPDLMIRLPKFKLKGTSDHYKVEQVRKRLLEGLG